jgi:hypothetical protein
MKKKKESRGNFQASLQTWRTGNKVAALVFVVLDLI